ncbi:MAG: hypothetical protein ACP5KI_06450 [Brevinematia bacterium]
MKKFLIIIFVFVFSFTSFAEVTVISSLRSYSHIYTNSTQFFSDVFLEVYGGNKYGGGIVLSPYTDGSLTNSFIYLNKLEFFVNVLDLFKVYYWYGVKDYVGLVSSYQSYFYNPSVDFSFKGWHWIDGTGINFDFSFFSDSLLINLYIYRNSLGNDAWGSSDFKITGIYRDVSLSLLSGISDNRLRFGLEFKTFFKSVNAYAVLGVDDIPLTNFIISIDKIYLLGEEKINISSIDSSWAVEQIITILLKPKFYRGLAKPDYISDLDVRGLIYIKFLKNIISGVEGLIKIYNLYGSVTQLGINSEVGPLIGFEENNILIKVQPMFLVFNSTTNVFSPFRVSISGELRF